MSEENKTKDVIDAVTGLVKAVPVYEDVVQPAAKEVGGALLTVAKAIHVVLAPVSALVWGYDQIKSFVGSRVAENLKGIPPEDIQTPKPNVAGPALEALKYTGHEPSLRELYANLLAASIDKKTAGLAHPSFVEIIKQLTPDEARLLKLFAQTRPFPLITVRRNFKEQSKGGIDILVHFSLLGFEANCELPNLTPTYLDNLSRLGLINIPSMTSYTNKSNYKALKEHPQIVSICSQIDAHPEQKSEITEEFAALTQLGIQFVNACVVDHQVLRNAQSK